MGGFAKHQRLSDFGTEMKRATLTGGGMAIQPLCEICGIHRSKGKHTRCSKIKQQRGFKR